MKDKQLEKLIHKLVKVSFIKGRLNQPKIRQIIDILKTLSKGNAIKSLTMYLELLKKRLDQNRLFIESPMRLSDSQINEIVKTVEKTTDVYETEVLVNPALLGGFRIKIGDQIYDDSVQSKISQVKEAIRA